MNLKDSENIGNPWMYFNIPTADLQEVQRDYAAMMGGKLSIIAKNEAYLVEKILHPAGLNVPSGQRGYQLAMLAVIASFIAQYYQKYKPEFKIRELPEDITFHFRYPYNQIRDYNFENLKRWHKTLPPEFQREVFVNA